MEEMSYEYEALNLAESMTKLLNNAEFIKIFIDGYMKEDLVYLGHNICNLPLEARSKSIEQMTARGIMKQYIDGIITSGVQAKEAIEQSQMSEETE